MPRARWTLNAFAALSLLLAVATSVQSVRSLWRADRVTWLPFANGRWSLEVLSNDGGLSVAAIRQNTPRPEDRQPALSATVEPAAPCYYTGFPDASHHHLAGFACDRLSYLDASVSSVTRYSATAPSRSCSSSSLCSPSSAFDRTCASTATPAAASAPPAPTTSAPPPPAAPSAAPPSTTPPVPIRKARTKPHAPLGSFINY